MSESKAKQKEEAAASAASPEEMPAEDFSSPQARIAASMAKAITPLIAREIISGKVAFVALTLVVDDKFGITFPYYPVIDPEAPEDEKFDLKVKTAKIDMLAAIEIAKAAARFKHKSLQALEEGFFDPKL